MMEIKRFFEYQSVRGPISSGELLAFKHACSADEYDAYVAACRAENIRLGISK